jgi:uncharacterized protein (TIGR02246 family)
MDSSPRRIEMQARHLSLAAVSLAVFLAGCTPAAPPPPPPDTHDADVKAIKDVETAWVQAFTTKDADKIATVYAEDASVLITDIPVINGIPAIKAALKPMVADKNFSITFASDKVDVAKSGDLGYSQGTYTMTSTAPKTKKAVTEKGKFVTVFKKQADGSWKALADIFNADAPAAPAK